MKLSSTHHRTGFLVSLLGAPLLAFGCSGTGAPTEPAERPARMASPATPATARRASVQMHEPTGCSGQSIEVVSDLTAEEAAACRALVVNFATSQGSMILDHVFT